MEFYEKLKKIREQKGMTQKELADLLNVSVQAISNWETNRRKPSSELYYYIADKLNVDLSQVIPDNEYNAFMDELKKGNNTLSNKGSANSSNIVYAIFIAVLSQNSVFYACSWRSVSCQLYHPGSFQALFVGHTSYADHLK